MKTLNQLLIIFLTTLLLWACKDDEAPAPIEAGSPIANAGPDANGTLGQKIVLDGSQSSDPAGATLTYLWAIKTKPEGSTATLSDGDKVRAEFTPDLSGSYTFELTVANENKSAKDEVRLTVAPPDYAGCTPVSSSIDEPTTWAKIAPAGMVDYCVTEDIWVNATLTIEPGVIIEFEEGKRINVDGGVIKATGTQSKRIVFTGKVKTKGYWKGIEMSATDSEENEFNYVDIAYAGSATHTSGYKAGLSLRNSAHVKVKNTVFSHSAGYGMVVPSGVLHEFSQNSFNDNAEAALFITSNLMGKLDATSQFAGNNGRDGVETAGGSVDYETEQLWPALRDGSKYFVLDNVFIYSGVKIQEGAVLEFASNKGIQISGQDAYLLAKGTASQPIVFSGIDKEKGFWKGIEFSSTTNNKNQLDYVVISFAGSTAHTSGYRAGISSRNSSTYAITNATISNTLGYGIAMGSGDFAQFANNTVHDNTQAAMAIPATAIGKLDKTSKFKGNNGMEGIEIYPASINLTTEQLWPAFEDGAKYFIMDRIYIYSGVKIEEGAILEFAADKGLNIEGNSAYLLARGTDTKRITFTGIEKSKGFWKGIEFSSTQNPRNEFDHAEVAYAGSTSHTSGYKSNISMRNSSSIKIYNSRIAESNGWGVAASGSSTLELDPAKPNTFVNNSLGNIAE